MRRFTEMVRKYNKNLRDKSQVAESVINILIDGGGLGDYLTFIFSFLCKLLDKKKTDNE